MTAAAADVLLAPNDRQDVVLMIELLHAIALLPPLEYSNHPLYQSARHILWLFGHIYFYLLTAYLDITLSLNDQLVRLSAAAHLILAIYHTDKGEFIPGQTCFDVMCMIKNIYFSMAKPRLMTPQAHFGSSYLEQMVWRRCLDRCTQWLGMIHMLINYNSQTGLMVLSSA